ncbi:MAG TPA: hypothetical protein VJ852_14050 [Gemmatimonadaceae bacterium]|nr:hypothetical protein [Gemmatimonadaceae bacterium]
MATTPSPRLVNIGPGERRKRLNAGIIGLSAGIVLAVLLIVLRAPAIWRLLLLFPFLFGALGVFQSRDKT